MNYKKIAVAIDFSEQSLKALDRAIRIAVNNSATLVLVHVVDTKSFGAIAAYDPRYTKQLTSEGTVQLEELKNKAQAEDVENVELIIKEGSPKAILTTLPEVELMICGETGFSGVEKWMLGSVAERIVRYSKYDVLVVR